MHEDVSESDFTIIIEDGLVGRHRRRRATQSIPVNPPSVIRVFLEKADSAIVYRDHHHGAMSIRRKWRRAFRIPSSSTEVVV